MIIVINTTYIKFKMKPITLTPAAILLFVITNPVWAEDESIVLPEIDVVGKQSSYIQLNKTATKTDQDLMDVPLTVNIVNQTFIKDVQAETLADVYPYIVGLSQSGTNANSFTLRGLESSLQNVQIDGLPGLASRFGSPSTANIERVEVLKGPASVLYGQMEPGGLINIITKQPQAKQQTSFSISAQSYASSDSKFGSDLGGTMTYDSTGALTEDESLLYRFIGSVENIDSFRDGVNYNNIYLYPTLTYQVNPNMVATIGMEYVKEKGDADDGLVAVNDDIDQTASIDTRYQEDGDFDNDEGLVFFGRLENKLSKDTKLRLNVRSVFHEDERKLFENNRVNDAANIEDSTLRRRDRHQLNKRQYHFLDANVSHKFTTGSIFHNMIVGVNGGFERADFERIRFGSNITPNINVFDPTYNEGTPVSITKGTDRVTDYYNSGVYAQDTVDFNEYFSVMLGARYDNQYVKYKENNSGYRDNQTTHAFLPQGGVVLRLTEALSLYASHSESFNPNSVEKRAVDNSAFDPEMGRQNEVGLKAALFNEKLNLSMAGFNIKKTNIVQVNSNGDNELLGGLESKGFELEMQVLPLDNWQIRVGYANTDSIVSSGPDESLIGMRNAFSPRHNGFIWTRYNYPSQLMGGTFGASLGVNYKSKQYTDADPTARVDIPSYSRVDLGFYYDVKKYHLSLNIQNLLDETYYIGGTRDTKIYPGDPRLVTLNMKIDI
jgi:iron complex outermembrane recepter protein